WDEEWQYAPLRMIFTIKPDLRHKARLVVGGHVTDASAYDTYASTLSTVNIRLLMHLAVKNKLNIISGDIGNAYLNASTKEKVYSTAGMEFGDLCGKKVIIRKALYGLKSSANAWYHELSKAMREMGFNKSSLDGSLWYKMREDQTGYDYIGHHVDDFIVAAKQPMIYLYQLGKKFTLTGGTPPETYLGQTLEMLEDQSGWKISTAEYLKKCLPIVTKISKREHLGTASTPTKTDWHPEMYTSPLLNDTKRREYQQLLGIGIWLVTIGRIDITFAITSLSRYTHIAREEHFDDLVRVFKYLNKYPNRYLTFEDGELLLEFPLQMKEIWKKKREEMKSYYVDATDEWDPSFPQPAGRSSRITVFVDADHASNLADRRSITGIIIFVDNALYKYVSKRQGTIESSTFGAEFAAMRVAVEESIAVQNTLRSLGIPTEPVTILGDNLSVIHNSTIPGSVLKKKHISIAYHKVRECVAAGIIEVSHITSKDNLADILTKSLGSIIFRQLLSRCMKGQGLGISIITEENEDEKRSSKNLIGLSLYERINSPIQIDNFVSSPPSNENLVESTIPGSNCSVLGSVQKSDGTGVTRELNMG
ncbi:MAG: reverse transcriptase domain-containing protein, partial [Microcystaceae cyanobacterium]